MTTQPYTKEHHILRDIPEALIALEYDKLGTVYVKADKVFIATCYGTGEFPRKQWEWYKKC